MAESLLMMKRRSNQRGVAIVETAITLLPFLVFLFAVVEAGWFFYVQVTLTNAAREGAKIATRPLTQTDTLMTDTDVKTYMATYLAPIGVSCTSCITITPETTASGQTRTRVRVQITYSPITLAMFSNLAFPIRGEAVMRKETSTP
jgi:Flp pilus assembly protein TadG